jgi:hypothetical protein
LHLPYNWGRPTEAPGVFELGGGDWWITWSPQCIHPYAAQWLQWSSQMGPSGRGAPPQSLWAYGLQTKDISD